jgi:hypothetical protein
MGLEYEQEYFWISTGQCNPKKNVKMWGKDFPEHQQVT